MPRFWLFIFRGSRVIYCCPRFSVKLLHTTTPRKGGGGACAHYKNSICLFTAIINTYTRTELFQTAPLSRDFFFFFFASALSTVLAAVFGLGNRQIEEKTGGSLKRACVSTRALSVGPSPGHQLWQRTGLGQVFRKQSGRGVRHAMMGVTTWLDWAGGQWGEANRRCLHDLGQVLLFGQNQNVFDLGQDVLISHRSKRF